MLQVVVVEKTDSVPLSPRCSSMSCVTISNIITVIIMTVMNQMMNIHIDQIHG